MNEQRREETTAATRGEPDEISFEEAFRRLETIVSTLETGRGELEDSLAKYEEGVRLLRRCRRILDGAQRRVELLKGLDESGAPELEAVDESALRSQTNVAGRQTPPASATKRPNASPIAPPNPTPGVFSPPIAPPPTAPPGAVRRPAPNADVQTDAATRRGVRRAPSKTVDFPPSGVEKTPPKRPEPPPRSRSFFDDEPPF